MDEITIRNKLGFLKLKCIHAILRIIPKEKDLVLCNAWFGQKYIDNPKYVYEYLLEHSDYKVYWITKNNVVYQKLKQEGKPVVMSNSFAGIIKQIRAQAVFSTVQFQEYNQRLLTNTIYIDLGHGHPIKDPGKDVLSKYVIELQRHYVENLHYFGIKASEYAKQKYQDVVRISPDHIFISDFARNDVFIDEVLREGKNEIVDKYKGDKKAIVYMPTHRSDGRKKMIIEEILPLDKIEKFCEANGFVFIIKKHFYHRKEVMDLSNYAHIFDITNVDEIDPQVLLYQSDILISDYSACYIDYLLLNRPLMFYHYDIDDYQKKERSLYIPFETIDIAPIAYSKDDFMCTLSMVCSSKDEFEEKRKKFMPHYFKNIHQDNGRKKVKEILDMLMDRYYHKKISK